MNNEPLDLDEYLASRFSDVQTEKLRLYEAVLAAVLRKYVPINKKVEVNLIRASKDTYLDVTLDDNGTAKISWGDDSSADFQ